jgi:hypothetical protein
VAADDCVARDAATQSFVGTPTPEGTVLRLHAGSTTTTCATRVRAGPEPVQSERVDTPYKGDRVDL